MSDIIHILAPGQGKKPIGWNQMEDMEALSFPAIYGGQPYHLANNVKISYADQIKWEFRNHDRRACLPEKLAYSAKKKMDETVFSTVMTYLSSERKV